MSTSSGLDNVSSSGRSMNKGSIRRETGKPTVMVDDFLSSYAGDSIGNGR